MISDDDKLLIYKKCLEDPQWESQHVSLRPLRGVQSEIITRVEKIVARHGAEVGTIRSARQTGKNETSAVLQRRHLFRNQNARKMMTWIRTAPTYIPQIVNSKKRLRELLQLKDSGIIKYPLFQNRKLIKEEGYIWRVGNAALEFISSGKQSNVVGGTANECLDMDEAHKIDKDKFDEDFAPMTADTSAATLLWGVAADGLDVIQYYYDKNEADGRKDLNLHYPCEVWMDVHAPYRVHVESRVKALGWDHPIIKTQYRLIPVSAEGRFLQPNHVRSLFSGDHLRQFKPKPGSRYQMLVDIAASNEDNSKNSMEGDGDTRTDSTIIWIYEVSPIVCSNGVFPIIKIVNLYWLTGVDLGAQEEEIKNQMIFWNIEKATIDGVGVGRQIAESMKKLFGDMVVNMYMANETSVSADCFDLQARLNYNAVQMFIDDGSPEYQEFIRQVGWTKYLSKNGKMKLLKPKADQHIDMVKGLTYINQNAPIAGMFEIYSVEGDYST